MTLTVLSETYRKTKKTTHYLNERQTTSSAHNHQTTLKTL